MEVETEVDSGCYLFPYEIVPKGSDIVIYGAGNVGTSFVRQLLQTNYCNIVAWVDKNYIKKENRYHDVVAVDVISNIEFDYVIVAVAGTNLGLQIVRQLVENKVDEKKIVFAERRYYPYEESKITLSDILNDRRNIVCLLNDYKKKNLREVDYFLNIYRDINDSDQADLVRDRVFAAIKECMNESLDVESKEILLRLLFLIRRFDREAMKKAFEIAKEEEDTSRKYWILSNIGIFEFLYPDSVYENFYIDKRKTYIDVSDGLIGGRQLPFNQNSTVKKVVILAQYLRGLDESLTKFVVMYANELAKTDYEVHIVLEEPFLYFYGESAISPYGASAVTSIDWKDKTDNYLDKRVIVHYSHETSLKDRYYSTICEVMTINPSFILDMCAKHSFLSAELYKHFPVICVSTGYNCNAALFHKYICRGKELCQELNRRYKSVEDSQIVELPVGTVFPEAQFEYKREDYGFSKDDFLIVIVGRRLGKEITDELADKLIELLIQNNQMRLLLVGGEVDVFDRKSKQLIDNKQIIPWGYEKDLPSLYKICDVFLNPDRVGAGWSITWAIGEELPVLSTDFPNDCTPLLGDLVVKGGYSALIEEIRKMFVDHAYHLEWKKRTRDRKEKCSFSAKIEKLIEVGESIKL